MKKFVILYYAPAEAMAAMATSTPEQKAKGMEPWMAWKAKNEKHILDFGAPLMGGQALNTSGNWAASGNQVTGYSLVEGSSVDEIKAICSDHPHLGWAEGCAVEVHECVSM